MGAFCHGYPMLKLLTKGGDGENDTVILGLDEGNISELKKDHPISFQALEVGLNDPRFILITYNGPDWEEYGESLKSNPGVGFCFVLHDETIERLRSGQDVLIGTPNYNFVLAYEKDLQALADRFKGGIGPETTVVNEGFAPGEEPQFFCN